MVLLSVRAESRTCIASRLRSIWQKTNRLIYISKRYYKKISPIDFSHSNIISIFNEEGEMTYQQEGLGTGYDKTVAKITEEAAKIN